MMALSVVPLQIDNLWFAIPASAVQEILGQRPWVAITGGSAELPGVVAWRGRAIALLDLTLVVGGASSVRAGESRRRTVVIEQDHCTLAIPVDAVREVQEVGDDRVHPAHATRQRFADSEIEVDGMPLPLIDLAALIAAVAPAEGSAA